ncbi:hypothetical protein [Alishewanella longhuensis]
MSVRKIIIDTIQRHELSSFTLDELRKFVAINGDAEYSASVVKGLYKNIWNMKKKGLLQLIKAHDSTENVYVVTDLLKTQYLKLPHKNHISLTEPTVFVETLNKKLNDYSIELATTSAEIKEYIEILRVFPEQGAQLNRAHQAAQERAFQLRGRLLAVENIIKSHQQ